MIVLIVIITIILILIITTVITIIITKSNIMIVISRLWDSGRGVLIRGLQVYPWTLRIPTIGALMITCATLGVPCYIYSIMGPRALFDD